MHLAGLLPIEALVLYGQVQGALHPGPNVTTLTTLDEYEKPRKPTRGEHDFALSAYPLFLDK